MEEKKRRKDFRFSEQVASELQEIASILNISETEAASRAIHSFYLQLKGEEEKTTQGAIVPFAEYQKLNEQFRQVIYKLGEMQGKLEEKENIIKMKDELIEEYKSKISEKTKERKFFWKFWK
ncbi:hypothetical protein [Hydrogenobaculum acidophilum]